EAAPEGNLKHIENDHPHQAVNPDSYDSNQWDGRNAYAYVANKDRCNLSCHDRPEKTCTGIRRLEKEALGANDKQQQMPADSELQKHYGPQMTRVEMKDCLQLRIGKPA